MGLSTLQLENERNKHRLGIEVIFARLFSRPPLGIDVRFTWGSDCLPGSTPGVPPPVATAQGAKLCSPLVPDSWRSITQVLSTWTPADCAAFANSVGASHFHLGCLHDAPVGGQRFQWERPVRVTATSVPPPVTTCGWGSSERSATGAVLVCSPLVGGRWRSAMAVPRGWRARDCHAFARTVGASEFQLGCVFAVPPPSGAGLRFNWGRSAGIAARFGAETLPSQNCGWIV